MKRLRSALIVLAVVLATLSFMPALERPARATSSVSWGTTGQFDSGNKSDPGPSYIAANGVDQPSNFEAQPRSWWDAATSTLYTVWQGLLNFTMFIASWNAASGWRGPYPVTYFNPSVGDGHGSPAVMVTPDGYVHVFCCSHATDQYDYRSIGAGDISAWTTFKLFNGSYTYPNPMVLPNGTAYLFIREGFSHSANLDYLFSTDNGASWSADHYPIRFVTNSTLTRRGLYFSNIEPSGDGANVWVAFSWAQAPLGDRHDLYVARIDLSTGHVFSTAGVDVGTSVTLAQANASLRVLITGDRQLFYPVLHMIQGNPFITYLVEQTPGGAVNVNWTRWNGASWSANATIFSTASANNMGDFQSAGGATVRAWFPFSTFDLTGGGVLYEWDFNGATWSQGQQIMGSDWSHAPMVTRNNPDIIVFDERAPGVQSGFPSVSNQFSRVWAWSQTGGFLYDNRTQSGTYGTYTSTDNQQIASGRFQLARAGVEHFSAPVPNGRSMFVDQMNYTGYTNCSKVTRSQASGVLHMEIGSAGLACLSGVITQANFTGTLSVTVEVNKITVPSTAQYELDLIDTPTYCVNTDPDSDGVLLQMDATSINFYKCQHGVVGDGVGHVIGSVATAANPVWLRLNRTAGSPPAFNAYYSTDGSTYSPVGGTWLDANVTGPLWSVLGQYAASGQLTKAEYDDWSFGSVGPNGWGTRYIGSWASPLQTYVPDSLVVPVNVTLTFSGVSASRYIQGVSLTASDGSIIYTNSTAITGGTSAVMGISSDDFVVVNLRQDWRVRVTLHGDGLGSPSVTNVSVQLAQVRTAGEVAYSSMLDAFFVIVFLVICAFLVIGAWVIKRRFF